MASFGDPTLHIDEEFYFYVGQRMLAGDLPYVDLWDRKPFGLFLLYAGIAFVSNSVIAYQLAAALSAGLTAFLLGKIVEPIVRRWVPFAIAFLYLAMLPWLGGFGGQTPVFYNSLMAGAALLIVRSVPALEQGAVPHSVYFAVALTGVALTMKQTVVVEAAFFGFFAVYVAFRNGLTASKAARHLCAFAVIGIAPFGAAGLFYAMNGHWAEFYQAMIASNLDKAGIDGGFRVFSAQTLAFPFLFPLALASAGLAVSERSTLRLFIFAWLCASVAALFIVPNFYWHYGLPVLLPVCVGCGLAFERWPIAAAVISVLGLLGLTHSRSFDVDFHRESAARFKYLVQQVDLHAPRGTLLVYDGPVYAYAATRTRPVSRVIFPNHFSELIESGTTGRPSIVELKEALEKRPSAVLFRPDGGYYGDNPETRKLVQQYVTENCTRISQHVSFESVSPRRTYLYGDCRDGP